MGAQILARSQMDFGRNAGEDEIASSPRARRTLVFTQWLVYHIAGGGSFFSGAACLLAAVGISSRARKGWARTTRNLLVAVGGILVVVSATPLPFAFYLVLCLSTLLWLAGETRPRWTSHRIVLGLRIAVAIAWSIAVLAEWPFHRNPQVPPLGHPVLGILGDSVTAGIGGEETSPGPNSSPDATAWWCETIRGPGPQWPRPCGRPKRYGMTSGSLARDRWQRSPREVRGPPGLNRGSKTC